MEWMGKNFEKRIDPRVLVPGAKTVVSLLASYHHPSHHQQIGILDKPLIAKYAQGRDYHKVLKKKLQDLKLVHRSKTTPGHWVRVVWQVLGIGETIRSCYLSLSTITTAHYMLSLIRFLELFFFAANKCIALGIFFCPCSLG